MLVAGTKWGEDFGSLHIRTYIQNTNYYTVAKQDILILVGEYV